MGAVHVALGPGGVSDGVRHEYQCEGLGTHVSFHESVVIENEPTLTNGVITFTLVGKKRRAQILHLAKDLCGRATPGASQSPSSVCGLPRKWRAPTVRSLEQFS